MGGIAGVLSRGSGPNVEGRSIHRMLGEMNHRGKQTQVTLLEHGVGMGSLYEENGSSGISYDKDKRVLVLVDGAIFNFPDIYRTGEMEINDAEYVLRLYKDRRESFVESIDGSYAIAIWDGNEGKLLLVRDRLGYKPLFYSALKGVLIFATEIKAILASNLYNKSVSLDTLDKFLSYAYVPNPDTLFNGIWQVKPGNILICKDGNISEKSYWKFSYRTSEQEKPEAYYKENFLALFESAVSRRLKRNPGCGAFLSGGLDTSGVVAMMRKLKNESFKVFTAGFKEERFNEIDDARIVSDHCGLDQHNIIVEFDHNFPSLIEKIVWHHDAPFADTSAVPSYYAAKLAREHVDTVLTGDFPDQLIGGSGHHVTALKRSREDPFVYRILRREGLHRFVNSLRWNAGGTSFIDKAKRMIYRETSSLEEQRIILGMPVPPLLKRRLYGTDLLKVSEESDALNVATGLYEQVKNEDLLNRLLYFDILSYAPDDLMVKVERMTMAHGLNAISPFHDRELVEFIASVPSGLKIKGTVRKYIMREALRSLLPEHTLNKRKQGFAMPIGEWLVTKMPDYVRDVLLDSRTLNRGYFDRRFMKKMVGDFLSGKTDYASGNEATIISLITLELWHRIFIDNQNSN